VLSDISSAVILCLSVSVQGGTDIGHIPLFESAANLDADLVFDQVCSQDFDKVRVCDTLSTFFCRKPQQVRCFVHVLDKWNVEKTRFKQVRSWLLTCLRPGF